MWMTVKCQLVNWMRTFVGWSKVISHEAYLKMYDNTKRVSWSLVSLAVMVEERGRLLCRPCSEELSVLAASVLGSHS